MKAKRVNIGSQIKKQLNGTKASISQIDTQDSQVLEHIEADMLYNAHQYQKVNILGVDVFIKVELENDN